MSFARSRTSTSSVAPFPVVDYRAKVKLHGTNCAVQITGDGASSPRAGPSLLTPDADYKGFATWVARARGLLRGAAAAAPSCSASGAAPASRRGWRSRRLAGSCSRCSPSSVGEPRLSYEPDELRALLPAAGAPADLHVLPWEGGAITIDYGARASLDAGRRAC